jgi:hypothetical protein
MRRPLRGPLVPVLVVVLALAATGIYRLTRSAGERNAFEIMSDSVRSLRAAADSCAAELELAQAELVQYRARLDELHTQVRDYEDVEPRTVPAELFSEYMELFDRYNDSTAVWAERVAAVQLQLEQCQAIATTHNETVDSLRVMPR